jgi:hypothetical protein
MHKPFSFRAKKTPALVNLRVGVISPISKGRIKANSIACINKKITEPGMSVNRNYKYFLSWPLQV